MFIVKFRCLMISWTAFGATQKAEFFDGVVAFRVLTSLPPLIQLCPFSVDYKLNVCFDVSYTVGVVRREESSEWLMWRSPERLQQVVTSTVVRAVELDRQTSHVRWVRTLQCVWVWLSGRLPLKYIWQMQHQLLHFVIRQRESKRTFQQVTPPDRLLTFALSYKTIMVSVLHCYRSLLNDA